MVKLNTMLMTNQKCRIWRYLRSDMKNNPVFEKSKVVGCNIIHAREEQITTSIRADSSGSQGMAGMRRATFRMQFKAYSDINFGTKVELLSQPNSYYRIIEVHPKYDAVGRLHHIQVDLEKI